ncbi:hypothetical protein [Nitrospira sp. Nam74]
MGTSVRGGLLVLVIGLGCAVAAYAAEQANQSRTPMENKMQKNEPSTQKPAQQKGREADLGSTRPTPDDGMKSKPTGKADKGQTDPLEQGGRSPSTSRDSSAGAGQ